MASYIRSDLEFILAQILLAEQHAATGSTDGLLPNPFVPFGLRTVDGSFNNLIAGQSEFGAADNVFPRLLTPLYRIATYDPDGPDGPAPAIVTSYTQTSGLVFDPEPRTISNLIVDQTIGNPAAVQAYVDAGQGILADGSQLDGEGNPYPVGTLLDLDGVAIPAGQTLFLGNTTPDEGLSAPFNSWFTFFGQFFDHGLDLVTKGQNGLVFIPLQPDDPLYVDGGNTNFMVLTRATNLPGPDGVIGTADDIHEHTNTTSPFVDQNQTYSSHPSHQVFLRAYELRDGVPVATGRLITNRELGEDGIFGTADDAELGGMATWKVVKAQARDLLGIELTDADVLSVPLLATDAYGNFLRGANGYPQVVMRTVGGDGILGTADDGTELVEGNPTAPISLANAVRTGHAFLDDIAHAAAPVGDHDGNPGTPQQALAADADDIAGGAPPALGQFDNELLDAHFIAGDGRVNENIGLTAVHHVFHAEHNRLVEHTKAVLLETAAGGDLSFLNQWLASPVTALPADLSTLEWNGERLFQAAKFGTEMQYQHLVFEEFARKVQPAVDVFLAPEGFDATIDAAIVAEFAHAVYRFGHSMLTETVDRFDPEFNVVGTDGEQTDLITAFLNPLAFAPAGFDADAAAGAIVRGTTRQLGNEIDEFVTEALRNNLLGLPLDLAAINLARGRDAGIPSLNEARAQFYAMTSDSQLKPYTSWVDFMDKLKHPESLVNFIAAYGTHDSITGVTTVADKRAAATLLVLGGEGEPADRLDFLHSTGSWAGEESGLNLVDLWIGGLAEEQMPFGGLLGSTFNFVFETQLEALQNGDRFYYLSRLAGLNFLTEMENASFAKLVMRNTDATHLPADIFSTPAWILEVNQALQFTGLGPDGRADPENGDPLVPLVIRDDPETAAVETNYLKYTGGDHVVLGGTAGEDTLIASIGDDTLWGDGGNDRLEGGDGVDNIEGGDGDDIITDAGGDDVLKGNAGNDVIHGGNGFNLILGGEGSDFIITGEDVSETFAGAGNDFILGAQMNLPTFGNEGDDWIEIGTSDGAGGDNFDPLEASPIIGHDVFITGGGFDEVDGEGGDDIMVGSDGADHFGGGGGFDWASYQNDRLGVSVDLTVNDRIEPPVAPSNQGLLDRFADVEGLSGSGFADILRGDDATAADLDVPGTLNNTLTNPALIDGLSALLPPGATSFNGGNILLGGAGSDLIEGRGGDDIIDGDRILNVRIAVHAGWDASGPTGPQIATFATMADPTLMRNMLEGVWNPGQLQIVREILDGPADFDTALYSGNAANYTVATNLDGSVSVTDNVGTDGSDTLWNIERLQFADQAVVLVPGLNAEPVGQLALSDTTPAINQLLTVSATGISDADNAGAGLAGRPVSYFWQAETLAGSGVFQDIVALGGGAPESAAGNSFRVTADLDGLALRVRAVYQDDHGVLESVFSPATAAVAGTIAAAPVVPLPTEGETSSAGIHLIRGDLQFILDQILIAERHAGGENLLDIIENSRVPFGLRTVDGSLNNLVRDQLHFGAADQDFPLLLDQVFRNDADGDSIDLNGPAPGGVLVNGNYARTGPGGSVVDADPRTISNLIVDQTITNPAAVQAYVDAGLGVLADGTQLDPEGVAYAPGTLLDLDGVAIPAGVTLGFSNVTPDEGLSAPFNSWFTFFGQFFDHGLDLVDKDGNGAVFIPLEDDDPLVAGADGIFGSADDLPESQRFMVLTRAHNTAVQAGEDRILNTADDVHFHNNETTPFVDQNQTYTSHASHQVFLREYTTDADGRTVATGRLLDGANGGIGNWAEVKAQAAALLGIALTDLDVLDVPLLATDAYGRFIPGANGFAQVVTNLGMIEGVAGGLDLTALPGGALVARSGHAFLNDIAHTAAPVNGQTGAALAADADELVGNPQAAGQYDDELLDAHFITGDGRGNENIGLTAVHFVFHAEHNRLVEHIKDVVLASNDADFIAQWQLPDGTWNGERLFQAARFGTEMQYQHLVFEEFARKVQPQVDVFLGEGQGYDSTINPAIVAEFAHVVYRFGHSMLTETIDRYDANFAVVGEGGEQISLIAAFLNPLSFAPEGMSDAQAAGAIIRGVTRQSGNEIDEFVTDALRNNLLGLPLDLPAINLARGRDTGVPSLNQARAEFYAMTGDSQLRPYSSWVDYLQHLKHPASLVNFIAAYGTHAQLQAADVDTLAEKRAVATALVMGGEAVLNAGTPEQRTFVADAADRLAFLHGDAVTTGVNDIDLWIGGLAEQQMPFGGLLGSTFNFVFENQMEKLQNGDRFYYLERTAGLNFLTELENNSFAKLIMANTDAVHLPGDVFSTPAYTLEVDPAAQFTGLGPDGRADPEGDNPLIPLVIRDDPATAGADENYLRYTGEDHVVLGGTEGNDTLIASIGDDTIWGDGGDDRIEGGYGNDMILGGAGDDIITDQGGEDNLQGGDGNDAIHGGNGLNLILGGFGHDFIVTGEDESEAFGGPGNDFIMGVRAVEMLFGNEGDDWIELGMADGSAGENFDTRGRDAIVGHDVFFGDSVSDRMGGEGGDDIMIGNGGRGDRYLGGSGFDWAVFTHETTGSVVDLNLRAFDETPVPPSLASTLARFESTEGLSGSAFSDMLHGDSETALTLPFSGFTGSVLNNIALIDGLQDFLGAGVTSFAGGNIILGGGGSDLLEGRGGDDLIDGDAWLNVQIGVYDDLAHSNLLERHTSMASLVERVFAGEINPGRLGIIRELVPDSEGFNFDTALYSGNRADYTVTNNDDGSVTVTDNVGEDGSDRLTHIERLQFADQSLTLVAGLNADPIGRLTIDDTTPDIGQTLTVSIAGVSDADNVGPGNPGGAITGTVAYTWQMEGAPGVFEDIIVATGLGDLRATGPSFTVTEDLAGVALRVRAVYQDAKGVLETVFSLPTAPAGGGDGPAFGAVLVSDTNPTEDQPLTAILDFSDPNGLTTATFAYQWQVDDGTGEFVDIEGATGASFAPGDAEVGRAVQVVVSYVDDQGFAGELTSAPTAAVANINDAPLGAPTISDLTPTLGQLLTVDLTSFTDADGIDPATLSSTWQAQTAPGVWTDLATGDSFTPGAAQVGLSLRVVTTYTDLFGQAESVTSGTTAVVGNVLAGGAGRDTLNGTAGDDVLAGGGNRDTLNGLDGNDRLEGGADRDALNGGNGDDILDGGAERDTLIGGAGDDLLDGGADRDTLDGGTGNDRLFGGADRDTLAGGAGDDFLDGGDERDTLTGGSGNDILIGGAEADIFVFAAGFGSDLITDFDANPAGGQDRIDLTALAIGNAFASRVLIDDLGTDTLLTIDGNTIVLAGVDNPGTITTADFLL
jgi:Ca2+-binding RTX toxin-like protein